MSTEPVGSREVKIDAAEWEGIWIAEGGVFPIGEVFRIEVSKSGGVLSVRNLGDPQPSPLFEVYLRRLKGQDWVFANLKNTDSDYVWARLTKRNDVILVWLPDREKLKASMDEGALPGDGTRLGPLEKNHLALIASEDRGVLFMWDAPLVFWRLKPLKNGGTAMK